MSKFESWLVAQEERGRIRDLLERRLAQPRSYVYERATSEALAVLSDLVNADDFQNLQSFLSSCNLIVEVGRGAGAFSSAFGSLAVNSTVLAVTLWPELSQSIIDRGDVKSRCKVLEGKIGALVLEDGSVDLLVVYDEVTERGHLAYLMSEARRVLKAGGKIVLLSQTVLSEAMWRSLAKELLEVNLVRLERGDFHETEDVISLECISVKAGDTQNFRTEKYWQQLLSKNNLELSFLSATGASGTSHSERKLVHVVGTKSERSIIPIGSFSDSDKYILNSIRPFTMTPPERVLCLIQAVQHILEQNIPGAVVECGVWKGGSMMTVALSLLRGGECERDLYLFDTFDGMSEPTAKDVDIHGKAASLILKEHSKDKLNHFWAYSPLDDVKANMAQTLYPAGRIKYIQGKVEDTLPRTETGNIALLRLDTDWYESTYHELVHLYPRLQSGGILILDDYGCWKGAQQAVDQYFREIPNPPILHEIDSEARYATKP